MPLARNAKWRAIPSKKKLHDRIATRSAAARQKLAAARARAGAVKREVEQMILGALPPPQ